MGSPLAAAATGKRESQKLLRQHNMALTINMIARYWRKIPNAPEELDERRLTLILGVSHLNQTPWIPEEQGLMVLQASHKVFGDPVQLAKDPFNLHQYEYKYYNSSEFTINVAPLGLIDGFKVPIVSVVPGGLITIPHGLAKGGTKSAVHGVAPQLKPCPSIEQDRLLDLTPASFAEWCTYNAYKLSECCERQILWSDVRQCLLCEKCKKETML